ncbi:pirin family protein [Ursidibacter arcticus]
MMIYQLPQNQGKGFISALYPNASRSKTDTGLGSIGRIDHAFLSRDSIVPMHPHINDEILSYFRSGKAIHSDSEGIQDTAHATRLMLMKAGKLYHHEEKIMGLDEPFEGLQIFIRPAVKDTQPSVHFWDLADKYSDNQWRLLASPNADTPLQFSSQTWVFDVRLTKDNMLSLPDVLRTHQSTAPLTYLLYVYQGNTSVNGLNLHKKDSVLITDENVQISTDDVAELVLFVTDESAVYFDGGMYSGNQF